MHVFSFNWITSLIRMLVPRIHRLTKLQCQERNTSLCIVCQGIQETLKKKNSINYCHCHCSWLPNRTWRYIPIAKDTMNSSHWNLRDDAIFEKSRYLNWNDYLSQHAKVLCELPREKIGQQFHPNVKPANHNGQTSKVYPVVQQWYSHLGDNQQNVLIVPKACSIEGNSCQVLSTEPQTCGWQGHRQ